VLNPPNRPQPADPRPQTLQYTGLFVEPQYANGPYAREEDDDTED
jgi:hypothetical protein